MTGIRTQRAAGALNDKLKQALIDAPEEADEGYFQQVGGAVVDSVLLVFERRIRAAMARAGVVLPDGPVTIQSLLQVVRDKSGLDIQELSPDGIRQAVEARIRAQVVEVLGVDVDLSAGRDEIVRAAALHAISTGRGNAIVPQRVADGLRQFAALRVVAGDVSRADLRAAQVRIAQRKYRARNSFRWVPR